MLILTRQIDEAVYIGETIRVRIISVKGKFVRLGIEAPREVPVHRKEIAARIAADAKKANRR
jgi:carbon storage regulator